MRNLDARLSFLEQVQAQVELPPVRIFQCNGEAEDGGLPLVDSLRPANVPPGFIWAMSVCGCAVEGLAGCRYRDADSEHFTIKIDRRDDLDEADE
jgi:hypothetical protein